MPGPKEKRDRAPETTEEERDVVRAPDDIEREQPGQPNPDIDRGRDMVERRPHRDDV